VQLDVPTVMGLGAALLNTAAYLPQALKTWRTQSTGDLSLAMILILLSGQVLWLCHAVLTTNIPLLIANGFSGTFTAVILYVKLRNTRAVTPTA
jgi:MtN3 and saliva related transmembrane protein